MPPLPTDDDKIRVVLDIFGHFGTRPGEMLMTNNFVAMVAKKGLRNQDITEGIKLGIAKGLFEDGPNSSIKLTEAGFAAI